MSPGLQVAVLGCMLVTACTDKHAAARAAVAGNYAADAERLLARGDYQRAQYAAELAAQYEPLDPSLRDLSVLASLALLAEQRPAASLEQLTRAAYQAETLAARDAPHAWLYDTVRSYEALARQDFPRAELLLRGAVTAKPDYAPAWLALGEALLALDNQKDALVAFTNASQHDPRNARAGATLGRLLLAQGKAQEAVDQLKTALSLVESGPMHATLAQALLQLGRAPEALPHLERAAALDARDGRTRLLLGEALLELGNRDGAARAFQAASELGQEPAATTARERLQSLALPK